MAWTTIKFTKNVEGEVRMKKSDLKTGMWVVDRKGNWAMVLLNTNNGDIISGQTWTPITTLNDDLSDKEGNKLYDIMKIYQPSGNKYYNFINATNIQLERGKELIWERIEKSQKEIELENLIEKLQGQLIEAHIELDKIKSK